LPTNGSSLLAADLLLGFVYDIKVAGAYSIVETSSAPSGWYSTPSPAYCNFSVAFPADSFRLYECRFNNTERAKLQITKLTNDVVNENRTWSFELYQGQQYGQNLLATGTTNSQGLLTFGNVLLNPLINYTLCELGLPVGWDSQWSQLVVWNDTNEDAAIQPEEISPDAGTTTDLEHAPFNPLFPYVFNTVEDIGTRCIILNPQNTFLYPGMTIALVINNTQPQTGGQARTPGYWKNWNRCSGGRQAITADNNGGSAQGFWLVEDTLPRVWDNVLVDALVVNITTCARAVSILSTRDCNNGKQYASDPAYRLAKHLFAYGSNQAAGAYSCPAAQTAADAALLLLDQINFTCSGVYKGAMTTVLQQQANALALILDQYNNNLDTLVC